MKASNRLLYSVFWIGVLAFTAFMSVRVYTEKLGSDIRLRHAEICCSHDRINPFAVWDQKLHSEKYCGLSRPDRPAEDRAGRRVVHAYPPWHTTYFWFCGWLQENHWIVLFNLICIPLVCLSGMIFFNRSVEMFPLREAIVVTVLMLFFTVGPIYRCIGAGNYGNLIAILSILFYWSLKKEYDVLAGILWAIMLIKPQVSALFVCPLLVSKKYKVIVIAGLLTFLATLWPAYLYGESPLNLILQTLSIGTPYAVAQGGVVLCAAKVCGSHGGLFVMGLSAILCFLLCCKTRFYESWWIRALPVVVVLRFWTYSNEVDFMICWGAYLIVILLALHRSVFSYITIGVAGANLACWFLRNRIEVSYVFSRDLLTAFIFAAVLWVMFSGRNRYLLKRVDRWLP